MEILERQKSSKLLVLEAIMRRLSEHDVEYNYFRDMYISQKKGYKGELYVDQLWKEVEISSPHFLLHSYEPINQAGNSHQMDTILLTPHFIWLLEIKNIGGRIDIDETKHQMIRTSLDGAIKSFRNPVNQINRHASYLNQIIRAIGTPLPIECGIVVVSDSTIIGSIPNGISIFHSSGLHAELNRLFGKYKGRPISLQQLEYVKNELVNRHSPKRWKPNINSEKLRKGVLCEKCEYKSVMLFKHGQFICSNCSVKSKKAYLQTLSDYRCLFGEWITNKELREFLNVESIYAANRLLKNLKWEYRGGYRQREYKIPDYIDFESLI